MASSEATSSKDEMIAHFQKLWIDGQQADVTIVCDSPAFMFRTHSMVISRCQLFADKLRPGLDGEKPRIIELGVVLNADTIKHLLNHLYGHDYQPNAPQGRDVEAAKGVIDHVKLYNLAGKYALPVLQAEVLATVETCLVELRCTIAQEAGSYHSLACDLANLESHAEAGAWSEEELQESIARTKADASDGRNQVNEILLAVAPAILEAYEGAVSADRAMKDLFLSVARRDRIQWFPRDENSGGTLPASRNLFATCPDFAYELASEETPKERRMHQRAFGYRVESPVEDSTQLWE